MLVLTSRVRCNLFVQANPYASPKLPSHRMWMNHYLLPNYNNSHISGAAVTKRAWSLCNTMKFQIDGSGCGKTWRISVSDVFFSFYCCWYSTEHNLQELHIQLSCSGRKSWHQRIVLEAVMLDMFKLGTRISHLLIICWCSINDHRVEIRQTLKGHFRDDHGDMGSPWCPKDRWLQNRSSCPVTSKINFAIRSRVAKNSANSLVIVLSLATAEAKVSQQISSAARSRHISVSTENAENLKL